MVVPYFYEQIELLCEDSIRIDSKQSSHKVNGNEVFFFILSNQKSCFSLGDF